MSSNLASTLHNYFGFSAFRAGQEEAIRSILNGCHTLVVMPTGAGKSLIYQLCAMQLEGITLVISPLIALMKDQVDSLIRRNLPVTYINSALSKSEQNLRLRQLINGAYRLVYIAPERLRSVAVLEALKSQKIDLLGWPLGMPLVRKIEPDLWEVRSHVKAGISRVLFTVEGDIMVLLHGFVKRSKKISLDDLSLARKRLSQLRGKR